MTYKDLVINQLGENVAASDTDILTTDVDEYMKEGLQTIVNSIPSDMLFQLESSQDFAVASTPAVGTPYTQPVGTHALNENATAYTDERDATKDSYHVFTLPANVTITAINYTLTWAWGGSGSGTFAATHRAGVTNNEKSFAAAGTTKITTTTYTQDTATVNVSLELPTSVSTTDGNTKILVVVATTNLSLGDRTLTTKPTISAITYSSQASEGVDVGTNKVLYVMREHDTETVTDGTKLMVECREVPPSLKGRLTAGSGWQEQATESDPVYYKQGSKVHILPQSLSTNSLVYWVKVPPSTWTSGTLPNANDYMGGSILKELEPILLSYTVMRCLQQKLAKVQIGASASIEEDIADEDFDIVQARQVLVQDLTQRVQEKEKDFQTGLALLQRGTYQDKTGDDVKRPPTYTGIAQ
mgnify:CR=1 FL=1